MTAGRSHKDMKKVQLIRGDTASRNRTMREIACCKGGRLRLGGHCLLRERSNEILLVGDGKNWPATSRRADAQSCNSEVHGEIGDPPSYRARPCASGVLGVDGFHASLSRVKRKAQMGSIGVVDPRRSLLYAPTLSL